MGGSYCNLMSEDGRKYAVALIEKTKGEDANFCEAFKNLSQEEIEGAIRYYEKVYDGFARLGKLNLLPKII